MLKQLIDTLIADTQESIEELKDCVGIYHGEFEPDNPTGWNPTEQAVFYQLISYKTIARSTSGKILKALTSIKVYAGAEAKLDVSPLDLVEKLFDLFDGSTVSVQISEEKTILLKCTISDDPMDFLVYDKGFESYTFILNFS